ncbi:cobalt/nickel transport system permease protein [Desulfitispora alkaliphila]|uniref:energy-coupling factor ABC transporter permease n=1 Tax=Desulfitispora alkaliphila TaxID=622674 RepID=UPI003D20295C
MSHIHLPDGIIPVSWWLTGYVVTFIVMAVLLKKFDTDSMRKKVPLTGVVAATMLIAMSIPLGIIPLHFSLAVLCGILLGPGLGFITVFVVNFILALFGHGGITVVGLNTLVMGSEVLVGFYIFNFLKERINLPRATFTTTVAAVLVSLSLMVGIVGVTAGLSETLPHHDCDHTKHVEVGHSHGHECFSEKVSDMHFIAFTGWTAILVILATGLVLEATVVTFAVSYLAKARPDLIFDHKEEGVG